MSIVYQTNKKTGITYAYESTSVWDPEKKQPRCKRKYLGRVTEDGSIIPAAKRYPHKSKVEADSLAVDSNNTADSNLAEVIRLKDEQIASLQKENDKLREILKQISNLSTSF